MGLRDYLMNLKSLEESTGSFASNAEAMRKQANMDAFNRELPSAIQSGDPQAIAQLGAKYGQQEYPQAYLGALLKKQLEESKPSKDITLSPQAIDATYAHLPSSTRDLAKKASGAEQKAILSSGSDAAEFQLKSRKQEQGETEADRRKYSNQINIFDKQFGKLSNDLYDTRVDIDTMKKMLELGNVPSQGTLLSMVSRKIAGERGVLTDNDIARLKSPTLGESLASFQNYISNNSEQTWPPEVKKAIGELVNAADERYKDVVKTKLVGRLNVAKGSSILFDKKNKKAIEPMQALAEQFGVQYNQKTDQYELPEEKTTTLTGDEALIAQLPEDMQDNARKALASTKDPAALEKIKLNIQKKIKR